VKGVGGGLGLEQWRIKTLENISLLQTTVIRLQKETKVLFVVVVFIFLLNYQCYLSPLFSDVTILYYHLCHLVKPYRLLFHFLQQIIIVDFSLFSVLRCKKERTPFFFCL
jgi:hypothetical protein